MIKPWQTTGKAPTEPDRIWERDNFRVTQDVIESGGMKPLELCVWLVIASFEKSGRTCYASLEHFGNLLGQSRAQLSRAFAALADSARKYPVTVKRTVSGNRYGVDYAPRGKYRVPIAILECPKLVPAEKVIAILVYNHWGEELSLIQMARWAGLDTRTVKRNLVGLYRMGILAEGDDGNTELHGPDAWQLPAERTKRVDKGTRDRLARGALTRDELKARRKKLFRAANAKLILKNGA